MAENSPWNQANADAMTVDSWGGGTQLSAFPPLVPVNSNGKSGLYQCPTHPQHRTTDPTSFCPLCESAWEDQRRELRAKRQSVEEQLQNLQSVDSAAAILQDLQVSMKEWKPQPEQDTQRTDFFGRTHPNNNGQNNTNSNGSRSYQSYQPNSRQQQEPPPPPPPPSLPNGGGGAGGMPPSFFSPFYDQSGGGGGGSGHPQMQAFAMQLHSMQRMQDWMLWQKEQECQALRNSLEEMRTEVQQLRVDKALLQEKLYQQEERMKHELKLIKLAALQQQQQQQQRKKSATGGSSTGANTSKGSMASGSQSQQQQPIVLLPDHMLTNHSNNSALSKNMETSQTRQTSTNSSQTTPKQATQSAFGTPSATPPPTTPANNLSLATYQSNDSPQKKSTALTPVPPEAIRRQRSHDDSTKSGHSGKSKNSRNSANKRKTKAPGSWILGRNRSKEPDVPAPLLESSSGPVDTDDWVPVHDQDDHEPEDIQQHPDMPGNDDQERIKDGYGTDESDDDDDNSFRKLVAKANSDDLHGPSDLFAAAADSGPTISPAPIKILNVAHGTEEVSFITKATEAPPPVGVRPPSFSSSRQWKPPSSSGPRGVSFPDTANDDDNASLGNTVASSTFGEDRQKVVDQVILDPYGDKGTYTGIILRSTGMPHGPGRMIYQEDRRTYDGEWRHGRWHGYGRATFANGDTYDGEYRFDQRHGRGRYQWSDGRVYDGMFREDRRHGRGTFTWPDGAVYEGEFRSGQREGQGSYQFSDGGRYEGSWKDGRYNGYGVCKWEDGRCYKGEWLNGMAHGKGIETFADGSVRHDGQWIEDEPCL